MMGMSGVGAIGAAQSGQIRQTAAAPQEGAVTGTAAAQASTGQQGNAIAQEAKAQLQMPQGAQSTQTGQPAQAQTQTGQGGQAAGTGGQPQQGQASAQPQASSGQSGPQMFFRASTPQGFSMNPGQTMWARVTDQQGGLYTLQMGNFTLQTRTNLPLALGQNIQVALSSSKGGQLQFQLLQTSAFSRMSQADLSSALAQINQPASGRNMQVARGMVEYGIPLTASNFTDMSRALAQLPRPATMTDMAACSFLKMCNMPMTSGNIQAMSNFIAMNPMLGSQLFEMQFQFDRDMKKGRSNLDNEALKAVEEMSDRLNKYVVDPKKHNSENMGKNLKRLANESGIERLDYRGGIKDNEEEWQLMSMMRRIYDAEKGDLLLKRAVTGRLADMARNVEQNLQAHQLINNGKPAGDLAFYYMQIPFRLDNEDVTAEVRIKYYDEEEGRVVDPENTKIEFDVTTERLGELHFKLSVNRGIINLDVGTQFEEVNEFVKEFAPRLQRKLENVGYALGKFRADAVEAFERPPLVQREEFETLERVNAQA